MISNPQREALPSTATPEDLAVALQALDLPNIPPENRAKAIFDRLGQLMASTITDRQRAQEMVVARLKALSTANQ